MVEDLWRIYEKCKKEKCFNYNTKWVNLEKGIFCANDKWVGEKALNESYTGT